MKPTKVDIVGGYGKTIYSRLIRHVAQSQIEHVGL